MTTSAVTPLIAELERESQATRKVLERVPREKLDWRPHPKSMTLGQLAIHVAGIPGHVARMAEGEAFNAADRTGGPPQPEPDTDFGARLDAALEESRSILSRWDSETAAAMWRLTAGDREIFSMPRVEMIRSMLLNHWYHHRGQLTVYLRLLDVAVPAVYGRSADERPFG
jgi:uncharacterized damage-inducible protein DinB